MYCARAWCRDLYITGFILYKMMMWMRARRLSGPMVVRSAVLFLNKVRCVGGLVGMISCLRGRKCVCEYSGGIALVYLCLRIFLYWGYKSWYLLVFCC